MLWDMGTDTIQAMSSRASPRCNPAQFSSLLKYKAGMDTRYCPKKQSQPPRTPVGNRVPGLSVNSLYPVPDTAVDLRENASEEASDTARRALRGR